ncbi:unnamed protein product [Ilex paraguariensis]|uniref:AAA+ ATPase domain-containing protein n=1 Tax=Ilex paraguariensis TaxID=185542 RepID=A0ABC8UQR9_9AQUA
MNLSHATTITFNNTKLSVHLPYRFTRAQAPSPYPMATQAIVLPHRPFQKDSTRADPTNETDGTEGWRLLRNNWRRSSTSSVNCSSSPSTIEKALELPEQKEKNMISLKSNSMGSSVRWSGMRRGIKTRKVIFQIGRRLKDSDKERTATKTKYLKDRVFSSEVISKEENDRKNWDSRNLSFNSAYQSKGKILLKTSLSLKYQPKLFQDIAGHEIIVKAMNSAVEKKQFAPLYLFHGPSGTGKTSTARIFAMAINCESTSPTKPCWSCRGCSRSLYIMELCSGSRTTGFERIKTLFHDTSSFNQAVPVFKVLIIEECHSFTGKAWDELLGMVERSSGSTVIFVLITTDANKVPKNMSSRCQKFCFPKLKDKDIALKLTKIAAREDIGIEREALKLIIAKSEGSLREAENILDQLALLGSTISSSMVQQLVRGPFFFFLNSKSSKSIGITVKLFFLFMPILLRTGRPCSPQ